MKKFLSVREAARELNCTLTYVFHLLWNDRLAGAKKEDRVWLIPLSAIDAYKKEQLQRAGGK
jgi:excisionase family DNA binding protein